MSDPTEPRDDSDRLKACPFCGGEANWHMDDVNAGGQWIECDRCGASTNMRYSLMDDCRPLLMEQWNRRALAAAPATKADSTEDSGYVCSVCKAPLRAGYACGVCGSDLADEAPSHSAPSEPTDEQIQRAIEKTVGEDWPHIGLVVKAALIPIARAVLALRSALPAQAKPASATAEAEPRQAPSDALTDEQIDDLRCRYTDKNESREDIRKLVRAAIAVQEQKESGNADQA